MARITGVYRQGVTVTSAFSSSIAEISSATSSWRAGEIPGLSHENRARLADQSQMLRAMNMGSSALHSYHSPEAVMSVQKLIV